MIPNILHFVFGLDANFGGKPFSLVHYLAVKSAIQLNQPEAVLFHYEYEPGGEYWDHIRKMVTLIPLKAPNTIFGKALKHHAHKADVVRLNALREYGGIYLDLDTISKRPLNPLLSHRCVLGMEGQVGLCNAVILAERNAEFIRLWIDAYQTFNADDWNYHSVVFPRALAAQRTNIIHVEGPEAFHYPLYTDPDLMFEKCHDFEGAYIHHLWEQALWGHIAELSESAILTKDTTYNVIARRFL